jgi:PAS domain S-box-containing protein
MQIDTADAFRRILHENRATAMRLVDAEGNCLLVSDAYCRLVGKQADDLVGELFTAPFRFQDGGACLETFRHHVRSRDLPAHDEIPYILWNGRQVWFEEYHVFLPSGAQDFVVLTLCRDISDHIHREEDLTSERDLMRTLIESTPDKIYIKDRRSRYVMNNLAHLKSIGLTKQEECLGKTSFDFFPPEMAEQYYSDEQELMRSGSPLVGREEEVLDKPSGCKVWHLTTKVPFRDASGNIIGVVGISRDITGSKLLQAEREKLILELQDALAKIKKLSGLVPICAWCKKIREDNGYWNSLDQYLAEHSDAILSHGICPECAQKVK